MLKWTVCLFLMTGLLAGQVEDVAARNAQQASEALWQGHRVTHAWLARQDAVTGLLPRTGKEPNWTVKDSAADLYPFMAICLRFTEPTLFDSEMRRILRQEVLLSTRVDRLSDDVLPGGKGFAFPTVDMDRIIFGSSEYAKDGLLPLAELLGETPWYHRLLGIATDIVRNASYDSPRGKLPARSSEVNGNMLQVLSRLAWRTGKEEFLNQALAIADFYLLDMLPVTNYLPADEWDFTTRKPERTIFILSDHGNEIVGGLAEAYLLALAKRPDRARQYEEPFTRMIDQLLKLGRNEDGVWVHTLDLASGEVTDGRHAHCWGYMFNGVYTAWMATGEEKYKQAVERAIEGVIQNPKYLFDETGAGRNWGANAYSDSIEGALVLLNRLPSEKLEQAIDDAVRKFLQRPGADGIVEDWYGDGNFIRTAMMYVFWKTQGAALAPWTRRVQLGAVREKDQLLLRVSADSTWQGLLRLDSARHRDFWQMERNSPRLNEWPEWYTVERDHEYSVSTDGRPVRTYLGWDLIAGIPLTLEAGESATVRIAPKMAKRK
jgi:hypothetical protein